MDDFKDSKKAIFTKSKQKIEPAISICISKLLNEKMAEQFQVITTKVLDDIIIVRLKELMSCAERYFIQEEEGLKLIKEIKTKLIEGLRYELENLVKDLTGVDVIDTHISFGAYNGELIIVFSLFKSLKD